MKSIFDKIDKIYYGSQDEDEMRNLINYYGQMKDLAKRCAEKRLNKKELNKKDQKELSEYCEIYLDTKRLTNRVLADIYEIILNQFTEAVIQFCELKRRREALSKIK